MTVTDANLATSVFDDIRSVIVAAAPYTTNGTTSATTAAAINAQYNDKESTRPQIVIVPIKAEEVFDRFGGNEGSKFINVPIECYGAKTLDIDQLSDQIKFAIKAYTFTGIDLVGLSEDYGFNTANQSKYHAKVVVFSFDRK